MLRVFNPVYLPEELRSPDGGCVPAHYARVNAGLIG